MFNFTIHTVRACVVAIFLLWFSCAALSQEAPPPPNPQSDEERRREQDRLNKAILDTVEINASRLTSAASAGNCGFWCWFNFFDWIHSWGSPTEFSVNKLCGIDNDLAGTPSTASDSDRLRAANAVAQFQFQGLGGQGRPFGTTIRIVFGDGGTEDYKFVGTMGEIIRVEGSLRVGDGLRGGCG